MRTRNTDNPKSATPKRTPPVRKTAVKTNTSDSAPESATPKTAETKHSSAAKAKQAMSNEITSSTATPVMVSEAKTEQPAVEEEKASSNSTSVTPEETKTSTNDASLMPDEMETPTNATSATPDAKVVPRKKSVVKRVVRIVKKTKPKTPAKTPTSERIFSVETPKTQQTVRADVVESTEEDTIDIKDTECMEKEEPAVQDIGVSREKEQTTIGIEESLVQNTAHLANKGKTIMGVGKSIAESAKVDKLYVGVRGESAEKEHIGMKMDAPPKKVAEPYKNDGPSCIEKIEELKAETNKVETESINHMPKIINMEESTNCDLQQYNTQPGQDEYGGDDRYGDYADRVDFEDHGEDDFIEEDPEEPAEDAEVLEEEHRELTAVAKERKIRKEYEIFVDGLDRDATEEEVRNVFENIGKVVEVRLLKDLSTNKNKGYAFVKFANKEHVKRALSEMRNPVIRGKRCGTAPSEDNDTLFLGNICNTWTKEAIRQKLKDYGVEGVENITLVPDVQHDGRSRGFAFLEFSCHVNAMLAYKRLQKPDVVFGHHERTAKVAFADPIREPDPEVMAQVKTVFLDGLPPYWDEDRVRECLKGNADIVRIVLARNMSSAKRKDFGFVDFSTHEAAVACIERLNNMELGDGNTKTRLRVRLSNPLPKTQAVKGGMRGGFLIGHASGGNFSRFRRGFGRVEHNWTNFQRGRGYHLREHGHTSRMGPREYDYDNRYSVFHGRQMTGRGRRGPFRGGYHPADRGVAAAAGPVRSSLNRPWSDAPERVHLGHVSSRRQPFSPHESFDRSFAGGHFDDPYFYDDGRHGMKRPFYMTDHDPDYAEPSRLRPRVDYTDPAPFFRDTGYRDNYEGGSDPYFHDYYGSDYGTYPSHYRDDRPYGGGYYR